jgi:hypothetical protein
MPLPFAVVTVLFYTRGPGLQGMAPTEKTAFAPAARARTALASGAGGECRHALPLVWRVAILAVALHADG